MRTQSLPEDILPDDNWLYGYKSDIELEMGKTRATRDANERERQSTDGEPRFLRCGVCRPTPLTERAIQIKLARKIHDKRRSKKNLEGLWSISPRFKYYQSEPNYVYHKRTGRRNRDAEEQWHCQIWHITRTADTVESFYRSTWASHKRITDWRTYSKP